MTAQPPTSGATTSRTIWHTLGALLLGILGFVIGAGAIALAATVIRSLLPAWLTGFTDWAPVAAPIAGVLLAAASCERFTPHYSRVAITFLFAAFGLSSVVLAVLQPFPQPALQSIIWSLAFLGASTVAFFMPALEALRSQRREMQVTPRPHNVTQSKSQNTDPT